MPHVDQDDLGQFAENALRQSKILKTELQIKNAKILTIASCCLFSPCTVPYICVKKREQGKLRSSPDRQLML